MTPSIEPTAARRPTAPVRPVTLSQGLCLDAGPDEKPCVWNVVAYEGEWQGHPAGAFKFTRQTFEQIIANFRADPRYKRRGSAAVDSASPDDIATGAFDVIQWDFHHAAEMPAPDVAVAGAPAQGWVLEVGIGQHDGKCALLVLTRWLEPARSYIRAQQYRWCSVSVWLNAIDPGTGKDVGAVLTSVAITNNPFLQGLPALQASRDARTDPPAANGPQETSMNETASGAKSAHDGPAAGAGGPNLRTALARIVAKSRNCAADDVSDGHILAAVENAAGLQAKIDELMNAIGAKTLAEALAKMSAADELRSKLSDALAGKAAAEEAMSGMEEEMVEEDVGMALASLGVTDARVRKALLAERGTTAESILAFRKTYEIDALKKAAREKLVEAAQKVTATKTGTQEPAHLTASIATERQTPPATPQQAEPVVATMAADGTFRLSMPQSREAAPSNRGVVTLAALRQQYPHEPNDYLRKVAFVKAEHAKNNPTATKLSHDEACEFAADMRLAG
jgi:NACalpha-BTF3-like transcription factor